MDPVVQLSARAFGAIVLLASGLAPEAGSWCPSTSRSVIALHLRGRGEVKVGAARLAQAAVGRRRSSRRPSRRP
eukprot:5214842-Pyramimonas_sp.AAC.1